MERTFAVAGAVLGFAAVALGAFGAHALQGRLSPTDAATYETAVRYQMYHALALLFVTWATSRWPGAAMGVAGWSFLVGTVIFSGSLYVLVFTGARWLGAVTPLGGVAFLVGWGALAWGVLRH